MILHIRDYRLSGLYNVVEYEAFENKSISFDCPYLKVEVSLIKLYKTCNWYTWLKIINFIVTDDFSQAKVFSKWV